MSAPVHTRTSLAADLRGLGIAAGDTVMAHAAFKKAGTVLGGPDALVDAILDAAGPGGTLLSYQDWEPGAEIWDGDGRVREEFRDHVPPYDPATARSAPYIGLLAATVGTRKGVLRSGNPGAAVAALGARAQEFTADHPLDYGYGEGSPLARLVAAGGKVLMVGAPLDTMTLLHHAEHLADLPGKRVIRMEYPLATPHGTEWRTVEEFDTCDPVVSAAPEDYFGTIVADYLATGAGARGRVGDADSVVAEAAEIVPFAVAWMEERYGR